MLSDPFLFDPSYKLGADKAAFLISTLQLRMSNLHIHKASNKYDNIQSWQCGIYCNWYCDKKYKV